MTMTVTHIANTFILLLVSTQAGLLLSWKLFSVQPWHMICRMFKRLAGALQKKRLWTAALKPECCSSRVARKCAFQHKSEINKKYQAAMQL